jgi:hypothetical protein
MAKCSMGNKSRTQKANKVCSKVYTNFFCVRQCENAKVRGVSGRLAKILNYKIVDSREYLFKLPSHVVTCTEFYQRSLYMKRTREYGQLEVNAMTKFFVVIKCLMIRAKCHRAFYDQS